MMDHHNYYTSPDFYDSNLEINNLKSETHQNNLITNMDSLSSNPMLTTASMPIPQRGNNGARELLTDLSEYVFDLETSQSPQMVQDISYTSVNTSGGTMFELQSPDIPLSSTWSEVVGPQNVSISKQEYQMEEEDIFQVDKSDLIQGPTLAELNGDNLYVDLLNIDEIIAAEQMSPTSGHLTQLEVSPHFTTTNNASAIQSSSVVPIQIFSQTTPQTPNNSLQSNSGFYEQDQATHASTSPYEIYQTTPTHSSIANSTAAFSPGSHSSHSPITLNSSVTPPPATFYHQTTNSGNVGVVQHNPKYTTLHDLLMKKDHAMQYRERRLGQSVPGHRPAISPGSSSGASRKLLTNLQPAGSSRLSTSAPTHLGLEQIWQRREPRPHLLSTGNSWRCHIIVQPLNVDSSILGSLAEAGSTSSLSTGGVLSPEAPDFSQDEGYSDDDSDDNYDDYSTDHGKSHLQYRQQMAALTCLPFFFILFFF